MKETMLTVKSNQKLTHDVFKLVLQADESEGIHCGQFINIGIPNRKDLILKRPFGIVDFDKTYRLITVCIQQKGEGTAELSRVKEGDRLSATLPLGNGFCLNDGHKKVVLLGGGIGVFPILSVPVTYPDKKYYSFLGFRDKNNAYLIEDYEKVSEKVFISTDDGSLDYKGFITERLKGQLDKIKPDIVLACGPGSMFKSLKEVMKNHTNIPALVSLEERMGCGIGACLVCTCKISDNDGNVKNKRVCADGPVFNLNEAVL